MCYTDGCRKYREVFESTNDCVTLHRRLLVGSELTVSLEVAATCCNAAYSGSRTITVDIAGYCEQTTACNCPFSQWYDLQEGNIEECPPECDFPVVDVNIDILSTLDNDDFYEFDATVTTAPGCEVVSYEWTCWRWDHINMQRVQVPCIDPTPNGVRIDITDFCDNDAVGAALVVTDDCDCMGGGSDEHQVRRDPCDIGIIFYYILPEGGYQFVLESTFPEECRPEIEWSASCGNVDLPFIETDDGIIVYPGFECLILTVCATAEGCEPLCLEVPVIIFPLSDGLSSSSPDIRERTKDKSVEQMYIYPNPAQNEVVIAISHSDLSEVTFYDNSGRKRLNKAGLDNNSYTVDISDLEKGLYMIELLDVNGNYHYKKLMVK